MSSDIAEVAIKYLSDEEKSSFIQIWAGLNANQRKLAIARLDYATKKDAAESIGLEPATAYKWNGIIEEAVSLLQKDRQFAALTILGHALPKAAGTKVAGLDSDNERIRQEVATEILDRHLGKPGTQLEIKVTLPEWKRRYDELGQG